jgi:septal ring factor EnvC (AmiA/AmiB activator)
VEFDQLKEGSIELGRLIEIEKLELERLRDTTNMTLEEFVNIIVAGADSCNKELQMHIEDQKQENLKMQSQITEIRKENSEIQQRIIMGGKTVEKVLDVVGDYKD